MSPLLEVQNLEKHFPIAGSRKIVQAVNGVDFSIEPGKTLALVGESGSGKTTIGAPSWALLKRLPARSDLTARRWAAASLR